MIVFCAIFPTPLTTLPPLFWVLEFLRTSSNRLAAVSASSFSSKVGKHKNRLIFLCSFGLDGQLRYLGRCSVWIGVLNFQRSVDSFCLHSHFRETNLPASSCLLAPPRRETAAAAAVGFGSNKQRSAGVVRESIEGDIHVRGR